jgi:hypothetical protein
MLHDDPIVINVRPAGDPHCWTNVSGRDSRMRLYVLGFVCSVTPLSVIASPLEHPEAHGAVVAPVVNQQRAWVGVKNLTEEPRAVCVEECTYSIDAADGSRVLGGHGGSTHGTLCDVSDNWHLVLPGQTYYFTQELQRPVSGYGNKVKVRLMVKSAPESGPLSAVRARAFKAEAPLR